MTNLKPSVVLVHGGFVDGSGWEGVQDPEERRPQKKVIFACLPRWPVSAGWGRRAGHEHADGLQPPNPWIRLKTDGIRSATTMTCRRIVVTTARRYN